MGFIDSTSHALQLLLALGGAVVLFAFAYMGFARALFIGIVVMIPFQPIDSGYGSINMAFTYVVGFAMLLSSFRQTSEKNIKVPLIFPFALLFIAFFMSWSFSPNLFWSKYVSYLIMIGSNVTLFYMSFSYFREEKDLESFFKALIVSNVLVVSYTIVQGFVGFGQFSLFGLQELSILENRADNRLVGPFLAVGVTAEYLIFQSLLLAHYMVQCGKFRRLGLALLLCNMAILVGTGNRGGFLVALLAIIVFLYFYKRYIGTRRVIQTGVGFLVMIIVSSFVMVKYTDFNVLFTRLLDTKVEGITPDSRVGWDVVVERIAEQPTIGHGPRIVKPEEFIPPPRNWPQGFITYYPHSLYLFILYTTGLVGLLAYSVWAVTYWKVLCRERRRKRFVSGIGLGLPTLGMIVFSLFLIDQFKVEFLRVYLLDYQHYLAALFGMFAAIGNVNVEDHIRIDNAHSMKEGRKLLSRKITL